MYWHWQHQLFTPILIIKTIIIIAVLGHRELYQQSYLPGYFFSPLQNLVFSLSLSMLPAFFLVLFISLFQDGLVSEAEEILIIQRIFSVPCLVSVLQSLPARDFQIILYLKYLSM